MLARYLPSSCVRPSVRPSQAGIVSKRLDESSWFLAWRLPSTYPTLRYKEIWVSPKIRVLPSGTLSQTSDLENFATVSRSRCITTRRRRRRSSLLSTSRGCKCHPLTTLICCGFVVQLVSTVDKILTDRVARSVCDSRVSCFHNIRIGQKFAVDKMNMAKTAVSHSGSKARGPALRPCL